MVNSAKKFQSKNVHMSRYISFLFLTPFKNILSCQEKKCKKVPTKKCEKVFYDKCKELPKKVGEKVTKKRCVWPKKRLQDDPSC